MGLVQIFLQISRIDKAVLETGGWNKNQLRNNNDFYVWEISQSLRISLFKKKRKYFADYSYFFAGT